MKKAQASTMRAHMGKAVSPVARIVLAWAFFMPGAWLSVRVWKQGDVAAVLWVVLYLAALALVLVLRYRSGAWRRIQLVEGARPG